MRLLPFFLLLSSGWFAQTTARQVIIPVDAVTPAKKPYNTWPVTAIMQQENTETVLLCSSPKQKIVPAQQQGLLQAVHLAYAQHHDLVLSPDELWIQIALGVSIHINQHFDSLAPLILRNPKRETFAVRMDSLIHFQENAWTSLIDTFALLAERKTTPAFYATMLPEFSTTTKETRSVMQVILLSSIEQAVEFYGASGCGIPNIILKGQKSDWETLYQHVSALDQYGLAFWTGELKPILQAFIDAYDGNINQSFWQQIYKYREGYMIMDMNGWISKFFPYFKQAEWIDDPEVIAELMNSHPKEAELAEGVSRNRYFINPHLKGDDYLFAAIDVRDLPNATCSVPLIWDNLFDADTNEQRHHFTLYAGLVGVTQTDRLALQAHAGWYMTESNSFYELDWNNYKGNGKHRTDFSVVAWSEQLLDSAALLPVYHPDRFNDAQESLEALKHELRAHVKRLFPQENIAGTAIQLVVSHFGGCATARIVGGTLSEKAQAELLLKLKKLDHGFHPVTLLSDNPDPEADERHQQVLTRYNSKLTLYF